MKNGKNREWLVLAAVTVQHAGMKLEYPDIYDRYATETVSVSSTVKEMKEKKTKKK